MLTLLEKCSKKATEVYRQAIEPNFSIRRTFLEMAKLGGQNHPDSRSICPVPCA